MLRSVDHLDDLRAVDGAVSQLQRAVHAYERGRISLGQMCWAIARAYDETEPAVHRHPRILRDSAA